MHSKNTSWRPAFEILGGNENEWKRRETRPRAAESQPDINVPPRNFFMTKGDLWHHQSRDLIFLLF